MSLQESLRTRDILVITNNYLHEGTAKTCLNTDHPVFLVSEEDLESENKKVLTQKAYKVADLVIGYHGMTDPAFDVRVGYAGTILSDNNQFGAFTETPVSQKRWPNSHEWTLIQRAVQQYDQFSVSLEKNYRTENGFEQTVKARELLGMFILFACANERFNESEHGLKDNKKIRDALCRKAKTVNKDYQTPDSKFTSFRSYIMGHIQSISKEACN